MSQIAVGEAAFEGFRLIARKPLAIVVWALVLLVIIAAPMAMFLSLMLPVYAELFSQSAAGIEPSPERMLAMQGRLMMINPLFMLASLFLRALMISAVYRAVLSPQDDRFFYLRFGKTELLVGLVYLCLMILMWIAIVGGGITIVAVCAILWFASKGLAIGVGILLALGLIGFSIWALMRLSMALPMTFAERRFRFFEAWGLTKGHSLSLLLICLLLIVIILLLEVVVGGVVAGSVLGYLAVHPMDEASLAAFFDRPASQWAMDLAPLGVLYAVLFALLGAAAEAIFIAPWAAAYRMIAPAAARTEAAA